MEPHPKFKAGECPGTYRVECPITEHDLVHMAQYLCRQRLAQGQPLTSPSEVFVHLRTVLQDYDHEVFAMLLLDNRHRVIRFIELFRGTIDMAAVYAREVVKAALVHNAAAVVLVHNHPSGCPEPSSADHHIHNRLKEALSTVDIRVLDHVIVGGEGQYSLAEHGQL